MNTDDHSTNILTGSGSDQSGNMTLPVPDNRGEKQQTDAPTKDGPGWIVQEPGHAGRDMHRRKGRSGDGTGIVIHRDTNHQFALSFICNIAMIDDQAFFLANLFKCRKHLMDLSPDDTRPF